MAFGGQLYNHMNDWLKAAKIICAVCNHTWEVEASKQHEEHECSRCGHVKPAEWVPPPAWEPGK